jgi:hypothetical protein
MPGDELLTTCKYATIDAEGESVKFGLETLDEMCFNVFGYYPASSMRYCINDGDVTEGGSCGWGENAIEYEPLQAFLPDVKEVPDRCQMDSALVEVSAQTEENDNFSDGSVETVVTGDAQVESGHETTDKGDFDDTGVQTMSSAVQLNVVTGSAVVGAIAFATLLW